LINGVTRLRNRKKTRNSIEIKEAVDVFFRDLEYLVDVVVVEGPRDVEALRNLGFEGRVTICSKVGVSDADLTESLADRNSKVIILTDFDEEGRELNRRLSRLFERRGVKIERGLRREAGRLMAYVGVYAIEALDDAIAL
jgi:5S rRNA maturation endonuclease (ribonuclease M5)